VPGASSRGSTYGRTSCFGAAEEAGEEASSISASREDCRSKKVDDIKAIPAKPTATKPTAMRADDALTVIQLATPAAIAATMNIQGATGE
jgi:hypothetical protein